MRRASWFLPTLLGAALLGGCGSEKNGEPLPSTPPAADRELTEEPEEDNSELQRALADQAVTLIRRTGDALAMITDRQTCERAGAQIDVITSHLEEVAVQMDAAGEPSPELVHEVRTRVGVADLAAREHLGRTIPAIQATHATVGRINASLKRLSEVREAPALRRYGIGVEQVE